ncbi:MAG: nucleotidyltransferase [Filimonas sp.]|nr:nucleotidyltransferase [Filimonas sp.]
MQPTLVILAAGMASRYGSMKQIQSFGPGGETIMDYSIYDAIRAGFKKVVFIIREDFAEDFKAIFEPKLKGRIETGYVFQKLDAFIGDRQIPADRTKPWGTGQAVLCCKGTVNEPFAVINADDFYGKDAFVKAYNFLTTKCSDKVYSVIAYELANTLSENGSVSRGVISLTGNKELAGITERTKIYRENDGIVFEEEGAVAPLAEDTIVSMNFFCFAPNFIDICESHFGKFLDENMSNPKAEFLMPAMADRYKAEGHGVIDVITTSAKWFGVTYKEDAPTVKASIEALVNAGEYPSQLWK